MTWEMMWSWERIKYLGITVVASFSHIDILWLIIHVGGCINYVHKCLDKNK